MSYIYVKLDAECVNNNNNQTKELSVIMRFDSEEQCEIAHDQMFDTALTSFNEVTKRLGN